MTSLRRLLSMLALLTLAACGGGGGTAGTPAFGSGSGGGTGSGGGAVTPVLTLALTLTDSTGQAVSSIVAGQPLRAQVVLRRNDVVLPNEVVQFSIEQPAELVKIEPSTGSLLTDANGAATVTVSSLGASTGAGRIIATSTVAGLTANAAANFFASGSTTTAPASLTLGPVEISSTAVSAYGTTGLRVRVLQNGAPYTAGPVTVNFTSSCAAGKATVTPSAITQPDGYAVATFVDNGCAQTADLLVNLTASIATDAETATMTVRSPTTGSLRFTSVLPADKSITLRGQGGNGRQENATVTFTLVDVAGQGVGNADVCFDITTYVGGLNVDGFAPGTLPSLPGSTVLCGSDSLSVVRYVKRTNADGTVSVQVNSGTVPTPVRVRARAIYPATASVPLESFSDTLSVSTGLPLQRSFSLSVNRANIDGGDFDGETATLTVRLADQFSNPVPDGTVVNFIASGGAVCTADNGSCKTANGVCSCAITSQARRPADRRVVVTAYAVGLEDFDDADGNNVYTPPAGGLPGDKFYDLGDAYVDANKDGIANSETVNGDTDILVPYQKSTEFTFKGDGKRGTAHIRASTVIYFSQSSSLGDPTAVIPLTSLFREYPLAASAVVSEPFVRLQPFCPQGSVLPQATVAVQLDDGLGNPMAAGTGLSAADSSNNIAPGSWLPGTVLSIGARRPEPSIDLPNLPKTLTWTSLASNSTVTTPHSVTVKGVEDKCSGTGSFALQVSSPRGAPAVARLLYEGEPRTTARRFFDVRYRERVSFDLETLGGGQLRLTPVSFVGAATGEVAGSIRVNWGDGTSETFPGSTFAPQAHTYTSTGTKNVTLTVITAAGVSYSTSRSIFVP